MIKPGIMCWMNHRCGISENIGVVVEVIELSRIENGCNLWHIYSRMPLLCYHERAPLAMYRQHSECEESCLTPINGIDVFETEHGTYTIETVGEQ